MNQLLKISTGVFAGVATVLIGDTVINAQTKNRVKKIAQKNYENYGLGQKGENK